MLMVNGNIGPNFSFTRYQALSDLDFDLSRSLKVKYNGVIGFPHTIWFPIDG